METMFVLKLMILIAGTVVQATHNQTFTTMEECTAFGPGEVQRMGKELSDKFPDAGTRIMGRCEPGKREDDGSI